MPANASVDTSPLDGATPDGYGWDWSQTTHEGRQGVVDDLLDAMRPAFVLDGKGLQGWSRSLVTFDAGGYQTGAVYFGGGRDDVHVRSTSSSAHETRQAVAAIASAKTSRVDTRFDTLVPFDELRALCHGVAGPRTLVRYYESSMGTEAKGRTVYIGSPKSDVVVRIYEKWLESPGLYVEGTNRVEVQLRPPSRGKAEVSGWSPVETFCVSKLTRRIAVELGADIAKPGSLQKKKGTPDLERSIRAMGEQYGGVVDRWLSHSGGDLGRVLDYLANRGEVDSD